MTNSEVRDLLEGRQVAIYFGALAVGIVTAKLLPDTTTWERGINLALAFMLFVTFLQVPLAQLGKAFVQIRFLVALLITNFVAIPLLVAGLLPFAPVDGMVRLGILMVLLCPCIDWVVTFSQMGRADARLLLAATPALLLVQMLLLPAYLHVFLGADTSALVRPGPFARAFLWLVCVPGIAAFLVQLWAARSKAGEQVSTVLGLLPVPVTAGVLLIVIASVVPRLDQELSTSLHIVPLYIVFAVCAPMLGWAVSRLFRLQAAAGRAVAFSGATRNSLVVLPLALSVPGAVPLLPAVIVTQTLVELLAELIFIRVIPRLGSGSS